MQNVDAHQRPRIMLSYFGLQAVSGVGMTEIDPQMFEV